ncbi:hypothetical protein IAT38_002086 [Cryptococcus sp. DSM 104549]
MAALRACSGSKAYPTLRRSFCATARSAYRANASSEGSKLSALHRSSDEAKGSPSALYRKSKDVSAPRKVEFQSGIGPSIEERAFYASDIDKEMGELWEEGYEAGGNLVAGLENGRVVECRRSGHVTLAVILASVAVGAKHRLLALRSSGEIWPISPHDVQFVLPLSLIPFSVIESAWSPDQLQEFNRAHQGGPPPEVPPEMLAARREISMMIRKVQIETEKMVRQLQGGAFENGITGGAQAVWDAFAPEDENQRGCVTAVEAAEFILNATAQTAEDKPAEPITVIPNTVAAYAAHNLLMRQPDMFMGDQGDMWATGIFLVRSRTEVHRLRRVHALVEETTAAGSKGGAAPIRSFVKKARQVLQVSQELRDKTADQPLAEAKVKLPTWDETDRDILSCFAGVMYEMRTIQTSPSLPIAIYISRLIHPNSDNVIGLQSVGKLLSDLGVILPWDSLENSRISETHERRLAMHSKSGRRAGPDQLLEGSELDHLREDYTSHRVFVIDEAEAHELDDGIALERIPGSDDVWIHVHVADPTRFIGIDHPIAVRASAIGGTTYLPEATRPMLPLEVVMKELSLGAAVTRDEGRQGVLTFSARVNPRGEVQDHKVKMGWIKNPRVITYESVDAAMGVEPPTVLYPFGRPVGEKKPPIPEITPADMDDLRVLWSLGKTIRAKRFSTCGWEMEIPSAYARPLPPVGSPNPNIYSPDNIPTAPSLFTGSLLTSYQITPHINPQLSARTLVAEMMILAGRVAGRFCHSRSLPAFFRGSTAPVPVGTHNTLEQMLEKRVPGTGSIDVFDVSEPGWFMSKRDVGLSPVSHWIMGLVGKEEGYVRVTSPLRRFDDMMGHWQIKAALAREAGEAGPLSKALDRDEVVHLGTLSDEGDVRVKKAGRVAERYWMLKTLLRQRHGLGLPEGWEINGEDAVDATGVLDARVLGSTTITAGGSTAACDAHIAKLGMVARLLLCTDQMVPNGHPIKLRITEADVWPVPVLKAVAVD